MPIEGIKVGDKLKDNDPRMYEGRTLEVVALYPNGVGAKDVFGRVRIYLAHRVFTDGKARRYGLSLVKP